MGANLSFLKNKAVTGKNQSMRKVDTLMRRAISEKIFPGAVLLVSKNQSVQIFKAYGYANLFDKLRMTRDTVFDLASLTKPLATTLAVIMLIQQGKLKLDGILCEVLPEFTHTEKARITIRQLLCHNSGLPDYRPYYRVLCKLSPERRKNRLRKFLLEEPLRYPPGQQVLYSDLGFMLLNWIVESVSQRRLDHFISETVYTPLGLSGLYFIDLEKKRRQDRFAATERCPWRNILLNGEVHDDNAYVVGGIEGHAGLFGTARDVHILLGVLLSSYYGYGSDSLFGQQTIRTFLERQGKAERPLGFDVPAVTDSSCGRYFSKTSVGHLGFTGTSFWMDIRRSIIIILFTNRVHPSRDNIQIRQFRPVLHDTVMKGMLGRN